MNFDHVRSYEKKVCYKYNFNGQVEILESFPANTRHRPNVRPMLGQHWVDVSGLPGKGMDVPAHTCPEVRTLYVHSENIPFRLRHFMEIVSENYLNLSKY